MYHMERKVGKTKIKISLFIKKNNVLIVLDYDAVVNQIMIYIFVCIMLYLGCQILGYCRKRS